MEKTRVLFVTEEITPYLKDSHIGKIGRHLPQGIQEKGKEIRTFIPRFGNINERRNQLHEVIRLSGMNLIIDDLDHPLIIKVASIQAARMQVYFIDNEDYFHRKFLFRDKNEKFYEDNDERAMFFARGVVETVKKLGWAPDVIHCHGWFSSLLPLYLKTMYKDNPLFSDSKIVISVYDDEFEEKLSERFFEKLKMDEMDESFLGNYKEADFKSLMKGAIDYADGIIIGSEQVDTEVSAYAAKSGKPILEYQDMDHYIDAYNEFYDKLIG
ncbi:MAG: glycogen/starch synthase [Bacteroidales bacterium]|nr:glycogen/starch synthase [Bacteroidales bacterium]